MNKAREVVAAGGVLWRAGAAGAPEIAVVHRPHYDDWSLPKGKLDRGERPIEAACREIGEETGFGVQVGPSLGTVHYLVAVPGAASAPKVVHYFAARATSGEFVPNHEVDELRWVAPADARLTYPHDTDVVARFAALPHVSACVLLARHGTAGKRALWPGEDSLRPLNEAGQAQAHALARVMPWYAPQRILSADRVRCTQTVEPLAERLGLRIEVEPRLSEERHQYDPRGTIQLVRDLTRGGGVVAASSQGGVIPDVVTHLAHADGLHLEDVRSAKGSLWCLFFDGPRLVAADYLPTLNA